MFFETTLEIYEKLARKLQAKGIAFEVSDCTISKDSSRHIHMEFGDLDNKTATLVASLADECCGIVATDSKKSPDYGKPVSYDDKVQVSTNDSLEIL